MQDQFCDKLTEAIQQAPTSDVATELSKILSRCKAAGEAGETPAPEASTLDSGGGGNTNPPQPPKPPVKGG
jgi:hypothetical protein